jgi:preprotein translocase subunit SecF
MFNLRKSILPFFPLVFVVFLFEFLVKKSFLPSYLVPAPSQVLNTLIQDKNTLLGAFCSMLLFGGVTIRYFVLALFIGIASGTYSSIFVASPILVLWQNWKTRKLKR